MGRKLDIVKGVASTIAETAVSAIAVILLYAIYVPFSIVRGLVSRKLIREFFTDVLDVLEAFNRRVFVRNR